MDADGLVSRVDAALAEGRFDAALGAVADAFGAVTATLHRAEPATATLHLVAQRGLPPHVAEITAVIPYGKGMAGICAERAEPVTVCNLQTDDSGVARPGARETGVAGALVVPVPSPRGGLAGTLGVGKHGAHDYSPGEVAALEAAARRLGAAISGGPDVT